MIFALMLMFMHNLCKIFKGKHGGEKSPPCDRFSALPWIFHYAILKIENINVVFALQFRLGRSALYITTHNKNPPVKPGVFHFRVKP